MKQVTYSLVRGSSLTLPFVVTSGNIDDVTGVTAKIKRVADSNTMVDPAKILEVYSREATDDLPAGWNIFMSALISSGLRAGKYMVDIRLEVGGGVEIKQPVIINITEGANA